MTYHAESDAQGKFTIPAVPPGKQKLIRLISRQFNGQTTFTHDKATEIEIQPGQTTTLTLGIIGYKVSAHVPWPGGVRQPEWNVSAVLLAPMPAVPPEVAGNPELLKQYHQSQPWRDALRSAFHHGQVTEDGSLVVDDVPPGDYTLSVNIWKRSAAINQPDSVASRLLKVTIPTDPPTGQLDLGTIELRSSPKP
jgi:hypothetical protein